MENPNAYTFTGKIEGIDFSEKELYLSNEEMSYIADKLGPYENLDQKDIFSGVTKLEDKIDLLFALTMYNDAWRILDENKEFIKFSTLMQFPFFRLNVNYNGIGLAPDTISVIKYYKNNGEIDDDNYMYYNIINSEFFDEGFMLSILGKFMMAKDLFEFMFNATHGIKMGETVEYVKCDETLRKIIYSITNKDTDLGVYISGYKKVVNFENSDIVYFIENHNIYENSIQDSIDSLVATNEDVLTYNYYRDFSAVMDSMYGKNSYLNPTFINAKNKIMMCAMTDYYYLASDNKYTETDFTRDIMNSDYTIVYPNTTATYIEKSVDDSKRSPIRKINVADSMIVGKYLYIPMLEIDHDMFDMSELLHTRMEMTPFLIYNKKTDSLYIGSKKRIVDITEDTETKIKNFCSGMTQADIVEMEISFNRFLKKLGKDTIENF